jgi:hypothetical protein
MGHRHKTEMEQESPGLRRKVRVMVFNATFYNISVISWHLTLLVEETGVT